MVEPQPDDIVVIRATEDWPEHLFRVDFVFNDCIGGYSVTGPLTGEYGEPDFDLVLRVHQRG
ncbi:hypothetical protein SAMN06265373_1066 [Shimia sagamensis]|uniref:Uncharacterized protein n=1 Tax=Shimia sagamensis TaxID=1566352 RepID=A0ABY1P7N2_9RHOB|nr:hypothetical protein SAMN06265373_1066 [Shimia sagamensis]